MEAIMRWWFLIYGLLIVYFAKQKNYYPCIKERTKKGKTVIFYHLQLIVRIRRELKESNSFQKNLM